MESGLWITEVLTVVNLLQSSERQWVVPFILILFIFLILEINRQRKVFFIVIVSTPLIDDVFLSNGLDPSSGILFFNLGFLF